MDKEVLGHFYIPYGSNKTPARGIELVELFNFYIPYGSNKTENHLSGGSPERDFISHMVQIKHDIVLTNPVPEAILYPIWFK